MAALRPVGLALVLLVLAQACAPRFWGVVWMADFAATSLIKGLYRETTDFVEFPGTKPFDLTQEAPFEAFRDDLNGIPDCFGGDFHGFLVTAAKSERVWVSLSWRN